MSDSDKNRPDQKDIPANIARSQSPGLSDERSQSSAIHLGILPSGALVDGRFEILEVLGQGGMGVVYRARDVVVNRTVALKALLPKLGGDQSGLLRLQREALTVARLSHPNIVRLLEFACPPDGVPFLVFEFVKGEPLSSLLEREGTLTESRIHNISLQVCAALEHAHEQNVLHRDCKPSNILLEDEDGGDTVKLVDFGLAKPTDMRDKQALTKTGAVIGSPLYMSPEQCDGKRLDNRSDIYSFGCCLYEMLMGTPPFVGSSMVQTMKMHVLDAPFRVTLGRQDLRHGEAWERIVMKALEKNPEDRYQTVKELLGDLLKLSSTDKPSATPRRETINKQKIAANNKIIALSLIGVAAAGCMAVAAYTMLSHHDVISTTSSNTKDRQSATATPASTAIKPSWNKWQAEIIDGERAFDRGNFDLARESYRRSLNTLNYLPRQRPNRPKLVASTGLIDLAIVEKGQAEAKRIMFELAVNETYEGGHLNKELLTLQPQLNRFVTLVEQGKLTPTDKRKFSELCLTRLLPMLKMPDMFDPVRAVSTLNKIALVQKQVPDTPLRDVIDTNMLMGIYCNILCKRTEARSAYDRVLPEIERALKTGDETMNFAAVSEAKFYLETGDLAKVKRLLAACSEGLKTQSHSDTFKNYMKGTIASIQARILEQEGRYEEAEKLFFLASELFEKVGADLDSTENNIELGNNYLRWGKRDKAASRLYSIVANLEQNPIIHNDILARALKGLSYCADSLPDNLHLKGCGRFLSKRALAIPQTNQLLRDNAT